MDLLTANQNIANVFDSSVVIVQAFRNGLTTENDVRVAIAELNQALSTLTDALSPSV